MLKKITKLGATLLLAIGFSSSTQAQSPFITEWDLSKIPYPNEQRNDVISFGVGTTTGIVTYQWETIPAGTSGTGTFTGTVASITGLPANAKIRLSIDPQNFNRFYTWYFNPEAGEEYFFDNPQKLINVAQWGDVAWSDMFAAFYYCENMEMTATDVPNLSGVTDMSYMFYEARIFNGSIGGWNVSNVKNMFSTFQYARAFNQAIGNWNTANVEDMTAMFINAEAFNQPLSNWNTAKVAQMGQMFSDAYAFNQPIGNWNIGQVVSMENMFYNATAFDQSLGGWGATLNPSVTLTGLLDNTPLSVANYDATLQGFASGTVTGRNLRAFGVKYCNKATRDVLTGTARNWTISDGGGLTPTSFITQPVSVATCAGLSAMFNVSATGITPLSYLWNTGATTTSINATTPQDFQVTVTGGCGVAVSTIAGFSIVTAPSIISQPLSVTTCAGISVPFIVSVTGNNLSYAWSNGLSTSNIMTTSQAGTYSVTASGICGNAVSNPFALLNTVCGSSTITSSVIVFLNTIPGTFTGTSGNLTWPTIAGAATYCIRYSKSSDFSSTIKTVCGLTSSSYLFVLSAAGLRTEATDETIYYQVAAVDANGNMSQWSASQSFVLRTDQTTSTNLPTYQSTNLTIYPNPVTNGEWKVENGEVGATVYVFNAQGAIVYSQIIASTTTEVSSKLSSGIYLVKVGTQMVKLVVE
ncbi:MAG: BspA family leucine-rich repeat surface protein [Bacteroidetes bacterium]|nr:MAG: BspA family leucine-rich repeat surface protein [Bacteroidota bacterium]